MNRVRDLGTLTFHFLFTYLERQTCIFKFFSRSLALTLKRFTDMNVLSELKIGRVNWDNSETFFLKGRGVGFGDSKMGLFLHTTKFHFMSDV